MLREKSFQEYQTYYSLLTVGDFQILLGFSL